MDSVLGLVRHGGNDSLFKAIEMSLLAALSGQPLHLHAEGLRGTGKTTIMRAARRVLPRIRRIKGCIYNCDPLHPTCPHHRNLSPQEVNNLGEEWVPMPFLEISHSAKVGTVVGSIDLARLVNPHSPEAALLPGTIPQAHRGIVFVDEINRLAETAPELADILLDVMGTKPGRVQIEETGLVPVELPVQVTVWAASNPDEEPGPLEEVRRQLSDRFDFAVYADRPGDSGVVEKILSAAEVPPWSHSISRVEETRLELYRTQILARLPALRTVQVPPPLRHRLADLYSRFNVESLRAVQALHLGLRLTAALGGRSEATAEDLAAIAPLALRHRVDPESMKKVTAHLCSLGPKAEPEAIPPVAAARNRYSSVGFGGVAAAQPPVPNAIAAPSVPDNPPAPSSPSLPAATWHPSPVDKPPAVRPDDWLSRTLSRLGRNLGLSQPDLMQRGAPETAVGQGPYGRNQALSGGLADPLTQPAVAPPNVARPLSQLKPHEYIRTEGELGRP